MPNLTSFMAWSFRSMADRSALRRRPVHVPQGCDHPDIQKQGSDSMIGRRVPEKGCTCVGEARLVDDHRCGVELSLAPTPVKSSQKNRPDAPYEGLPPNRWMPGTNAKCPKRRSVWRVLNDKWIIGFWRVRLLTERRWIRARASWACRHRGTSEMSGVNRPGNGDCSGPVGVEAVFETPDQDDEGQIRGSARRAGRGRVPKRASGPARSARPARPGRPRLAAGAGRSAVAIGAIASSSLAPPR